MEPKQNYSVNAGKYIADARNKNYAPNQLSLSLRNFFASLATSLLQIFTQLHSFEYGTRLIR
jgi:hypothetical protein